MGHKFRWAAAKEALLHRVDYTVYYKRRYPGWMPGQNISCPNIAAHEDAKDETPSCKVFDTSGKGGVPGGGLCHTCGAKFSSIIGHRELELGLEGTEGFSAAIWHVWNECLEPLVPLSDVNAMHEALIDSRKVMAWLNRQRAIDKNIVKALTMGLNRDNGRIAFPIPNEFGLWVNVRQWDWQHKHPVKFLPWGKRGAGFGGNRLYPIWALESSQEVIWVEGEPDAACAMGLGFAAVTGGPANSWKDEWGPSFSGRNVAVFGDVGDATKAGQIGQDKVAAGILPFAASVRKVIPPIDKDGGDFTDLVVEENYDQDDIGGLIEAAEIEIGDKTSASASAVSTLGTMDDPAIILRRPLTEIDGVVPLAAASSADHYMAKYRLHVHVAGRDLAPYLSPELVKVKCQVDRGQKCSFCHMKKAGGTKVFKFHSDDPAVLAMVDCTINQTKGTVKDTCGIPKLCPIDMEVLKSRSVEKLIVIPDVSSNKASDDGRYVLRTAYALKHGLEPNKAYETDAYTAPDPRSMVATHVMTDVRPMQNDLDTFDLEGNMDLLEAFRPEEWTCNTVLEKLDDVAADMADNVTMIYGRPDLHMAVDAVFHSVLQFWFNREFVHKGWLDALVVGDTRCGKGYVAEGLIRHYGAGTVVSAENCSYAGLIGGMQQVQGRWNITWGQIPLNDRRMVIIDEVSGLSTDEIGRMSRIRSEGIAEITKIQTEKTRARTRLLWMGNARSGESISSYSYGVEAIPELAGALEDVARFDFAIAVASNEVDSSIINRLRGETVAPKYSSEACRACVIWVWSRTPEQVRFEHDATVYILGQGVAAMAARYHPSIPLVQVENIRIKIARLAAALAGRTFSAEAAGGLVVRKCHAEAAVELLRMWYDKPAMSYHNYSDTALEHSTLEDEEVVVDAINGWKGNTPTLIRGLLGSKRITVTDVANFIGEDRYMASDLIAELVRQRALYKDHSFYRLRPAAIILLREMKTALTDTLDLV